MVKHEAFSFLGNACLQIKHVEHTKTISRHIHYTVQSTQHDNIAVASDIYSSIILVNKPNLFTLVY